MADTGAVLTGLGTNDSSVGTVAWSNPNNITSQTDFPTAQIFAMSGSVTSQYIKATDFEFSIPDGSNIEGIEITIRKYFQDSGIAQDNEVRIVKSDGSIGTENKAVGGNWPSIPTSFNYGSSSDLWDESWSADDINDSDFGVVLSANIFHSGASSADVSWVAITVYYTEPTPPSETFLLQQNSRLLFQQNGRGILI